MIVNVSDEDEVLAPLQLADFHSKDFHQKHIWNLTNTDVLGIPR